MANQHNSIDLRYIAMTLQTKGYTALVDVEDYKFVSYFKWFVTTQGNNFYVRCNIKLNSGKWGRMALHRFIMEAKPDECVDHINGNGLDNRRCNLRLCSSDENKRNSRPFITKTTSKYKGVHWKKSFKKWAAGIHHKGKNVFLGYFENEIDAARAYNSAAKKYFGEFAYLNPLPEIVE